jgi:AraC-like DNA-binding protein
MQTSAGPSDHPLPHHEINNLKYSGQILDLLVEAMSFAEDDETTALALVKRASLLMKPDSVPEKPAARDQIVSGGLAAWQVSRLKTYIATNIASAVSLEELAQLVRLSTSYFSTAFKASFGISPHNYVIRQRVAFAKHRMISTDAPLSEIALDCGLSDQAHLSRVFRRVTGTTPSTWRRYAAGKDAIVMPVAHGKGKDEIAFWN